MSDIVTISSKASPTNHAAGPARGMRRLLTADSTGLTVEELRSRSFVKIMKGRRKS